MRQEGAGTAIAASHLRILKCHFIILIQWLITGSQEAPLMQGVSESMAGRAAILQLYPLSSRESAKVNLLHGGYPEAVARPGSAQLWFSSYLQTYLERDVRAVTAVRDLATFRRFLGLLASRHGQVLNKTEVNAGRRRELYHFRDEQGLEVDFVTPGRGGSLRLVESRRGKR